MAGALPQGAPSGGGAGIVFLHCQGCGRTRHHSKHFRRSCECCACQLHFEEADAE